MKKRLLIKLRTVIVLLGMMIIFVPAAQANHIREIDDDSSVGKETHTLRLEFWTTDPVSSIASGSNCDASYIMFLLPDDAHYSGYSGYGGSDIFFPGNSLGKYLGGNFMKNKYSGHLEFQGADAYPQGVELYNQVQLYNYALSYKILIDGTQFTSGNLSVKNGKVYGGLWDHTGRIKAGSSTYHINSAPTPQASGSSSISFTQTGRTQKNGDLGEHYSTSLSDGGRTFMIGCVISESLVQESSDAAFSADGITLDSVNKKLTINWSAINASGQERKFRIKSTVAMEDTYGKHRGSSITAYSPVITIRPFKTTITLDKQGGSGGTDSVSPIYGKTFTVTPPTRIGCTFKGYFTEANGAGTKYINADGSNAAINNFTASSKTLYAYWDPNSITFRYHPNGGSLPDNYVTWEAKASDKFPDNHWNYANSGDPYYMTRTGYTATGDYAKADGSCSFHQDDDFTSYADLCDKYGVSTSTKSTIIDIYAQWKPNTYTVRYDANRPSHASTNVTGTMADSSHIYDQAKALTENGYALVGWTFEGWNTKADGTGTPYDDQASVLNLTSTHDAVVTLYAQWSANTYGVTFNPNGMDSDVSQEGKNVVFNDTYGTLPVPTRTGYTFDGWFTQETGGSEVTETTQVITEKAHTLYARWTPITYTITKGNIPENGDYALSQTKGIIYDTVTITTTPDKYYIVDTLTVKKSNGDSVAVSGMDLPTGPFTFEMPADDVTVNLTFRDSRKVLSIQLPDQTYAYTGESFAYDCSEAVITCGGAAVSGYWDKLNITYFDEEGDSGYTAPPSDVYAHSRLVKASFPGDDIYQPAESSNLANHTINPSPVTMRLKDKSAYWGDEISDITLSYGDVEIVCEANLLESKKLQLQQLIAELIADGRLVIKPDRSGSMDQTIIDSLTFELRHGGTTYPYALIHPLGYDKVKQYSFLPAALGNYSIDFDRGDVHLLALAPVIHGISLSAEYTVGDAPEHLSAQASTADGGILSYQWYATPDLLTEGKALKGETGPFFTPRTSEEYSEYYYCVVTNTNAAATGQTIATTTSEPVKITVLPPVPVHEAKITIQAHKQYDHVHAQLMPLGITEPLNARNLPQIPGTNPEEYLYNETIVDGLYNLVITAYEQGSLKTATITTLVDLRGHDAVHSVILPAAEKHSIVKDETETGIIVGAVNQAADSREPVDPEGHLEVVITTNKGYDKDNKKEHAKQIKEQADKDSRTVEIELDIDLTLYQNDKDGNVISEENLGNTNAQLLEILIPVNTQDRQIEGFGVYRMHNGQLQSLPYGEGEEYFTVDLEGGFITLMVKRFSSYAISYGLPLLPETGDTSNLELWLFIGMMSLAGALLLKKRSRSV